MQPSATSFAKFVAEPKLFDIYHCGFREQVREEFGVFMGIEEKSRAH